MYICMEAIHHKHKGKSPLNYSFTLIAYLFQFICASKYVLLPCLQLVSLLLSQYIIPKSMLISKIYSYIWHQLMPSHPVGALKYESKEIIYFLDQVEKNGLKPWTPKGFGIMDGNKAPWFFFYQ
ncbi:hypothetical protein XELAEV_18030199mg [Xenopus laevis]|uniref:Uncharacterized protein n=1 Tax=Xenopus laevis TaxID=8355 RepID=A0A974CUQ6_XENLA|nr:hypothetical protein XELAEV_18030199mg [Xenopus laevis]